jgi:hypothetical protein
VSNWIISVLESRGCETGINEVSGPLKLKQPFCMSSRMLCMYVRIARCKVFMYMHTKVAEVKCIVK